MRGIIVNFNTDDSSSILKLIGFIFSVLAPVLAGYIGVVYGLKQIKLQKKIDSIENQLNKFYSPLLGLRNEIKAKSEVREKINKLSKTQVPATGSDPSFERLVDDVNKDIEYDNKQMQEEFLPQYNKMLLIFKDNLWLSEPETRKFYYDLVEFVEIWNRSYAGALSEKVAIQIEHSEKKIKPFYDELEIRTDLLRKKILEF